MATANKDVVEGKAKKASGSLKERWGELTDDSQSIWRGRYEQLIGNIQERYGYTRQRAEDELYHRITAIGDTLQEKKDAAVSAVQETTQQAATKVDETVVEHRWKTVLLALVLGAVIGYLVGSQNNA